MTIEVERLSLWELCERNLEGRFLCWVNWGIGREGSGDGHLFPYGARWNTWKGISFMEVFERWLKVTIEVGRLSLWELCERNLDGGLPGWVTWWISRRVSGEGHLFP